MGDGARRAAADAPHPGLRVPVPGDGAGSGDWAQVPWVDGIPILFPDPAAYLSAAGDLATAPIDAFEFDGMYHLARYLPLVADTDAPLRCAVREILRAHAPAGARLGVDAGCSVGPNVADLRAVCAHVIGVDGHLGALRVARALYDGLPVDVPARIEGHRFEWADVVTLPALDGVTFACGDMLDPPVQAGAADVVLALNLIDNVHDPVNLIGQLDAILAPGGLLVLSSPFAWQDALTPPQHQLGGGTVPGFSQLGSEAALQALLRGETPFFPHLDYATLETRDVPWTLRNHARATSIYDVFVLAMRKAS